MCEMVRNRASTQKKYSLTPPPSLPLSLSFPNTYHVQKRAQRQTLHPFLPPALAVPPCLGHGQDDLEGAHGLLEEGGEEGGEAGEVACEGRRGRDRWVRGRKERRDGRWAR